MRPFSSYLFAAVYAAGWAASMAAEKGWFGIPRWEGDAIDSYTLLLNRSNASFPLNHSLIGQDAGTECWNPYGNNGYYPYWGYGQDFYFKKVGNSGEWKQCTANSCRWGSRPVSQNSAFNNFYMDEWCACKPGYFASSASFLASLAGGYDNADARPVGYCYQDPAAYDDIACSGCPGEHYCPGEATCQNLCQQSACGGTCRYPKICMHNLLSRNQGKKHCLGGCNSLLHLFYYL
jgi:hypothetical protein